FDGGVPTASQYVLGLSVDPDYPTVYRFLMDYHRSAYRPHILVAYYYCSPDSSKIPNTALIRVVFTDPTVFPNTSRPSAFVQINIKISTPNDLHSDFPF
ncbi:13327_t:CDS:2, partial [Racocetra persica]